MDKKIENHNSLWAVMKSSIIYIIKAETSTIEAKLNLLFGVLSILFVFTCAASSFVEIILKFLKPELEFGFNPTSILAMFFLVLVYFTLCIRYVAGLNKLEERLKEYNKST